MQTYIGIAHFEKGLLEMIGGKYKFTVKRNEDKDIEPCMECGCEVATHIFPSHPSPSHPSVDAQRLCFICANIIGKSTDVITKDMFCQGLNVLLQLIEEKL